VLALPRPVDRVLQHMRDAGILGGLDLSAAAPEFGEGVLVCVTETKVDADLDRYIEALRDALRRTPA
jgi:glycine dehydrogenase subunit 1